MFKTINRKALAAVACAIIVPLAACTPSAGNNGLGNSALGISKSCKQEKKVLDSMHARGRSHTKKYKDLLDKYLSRCF